MAPAALMALVVVISGVSLVLDQLWLDAASIELQTAAESAALAAGGELATDDLLRLEYSQEKILQRARRKATQIAATNRIAGTPVQLDSSAGGDIRFGQTVVQSSTGREVFVETDYQPATVVTRAEHSRSGNNPVALFLHGLTGTTGGDVTAIAEASIDNRLVGVQPLNGVPIPALPLAILKSNIDGRSLETWDSAIVKRQGSDRFSYHEDTGDISSGPDGIPEIRLWSAGRNEDIENSSVFLFAVRHDAIREDIVRHIHSGWTDSDLPDGIQQLRFDQSPAEYLTLGSIGGSLGSGLGDIAGQCRIVFLYDSFQAGAHSREGRIRCVRAVAGRILSIQLFSNGAREIIFQPGVLTTRTALLADETHFSGPWDSLANPYIYKLRLTY